MKDGGKEKGEKERNTIFSKKENVLCVQGIVAQRTIIFSKMYDKWFHL